MTVMLQLEWRLSDESIAEKCSEKEKDGVYRESVTCKIFMGFTSNLISSGVRESIRYLAQHRLVSSHFTHTFIYCTQSLVFCVAP